MTNRMLTPNNNSSSSMLFAFTLLFVALAGCGSSGSKGASPPFPQSNDAAKNTVANNSNCNSLGDFYWEIGNTDGPLVSGAVGTTYSSTTEMDIASASKLIFGAYVVEGHKNDLSTADPQQAMRMRSGRVSLQYVLCVNKTTVDDCYKAIHLNLTDRNSDLTAEDAGKFYYNGGHFQWYADVGLSLGDRTNNTLATEMKSQLGQELNIAYSSPQLAAGAHMSAAGYAQFLRKIISGGLAIRDHLGEDSVCTLPSSCPNDAIYSPVDPYAWHYSWGHWIEDDPNNGDDGAFSSPGAFGFYPWIDASKKYYGILARKAGTIDYSQGVPVSAAEGSVKCGRSIRAAFLTGVEVTQ
jgi:hypothetical protein